MSFLRANSVRTRAWFPASSGDIRQGFTLIELLFVVAIIAVVASLLLSGLAQAKQRAHLAACRNNLRQWGIAMHMYLEDEGAYPHYNDYWTAASNRFSVHWYERLEHCTSVKWPRSFAPATTEKGIHVCPGYNRVNGYFDTRVGSYGYNSDGVGRGEFDGLGLGGTPSRVWPVRENEVAVPSDMIAIGDSIVAISLPHPPYIGGPDVFAPNQWALPFWVPPVDPLDQDSVIRNARDAARNRHVNRWNTLFCDGHVESLKRADLFEYRSPAVRKRWNKDNFAHFEFYP